MSDWRIVHLGDFVNFRRPVEGCRQDRASKTAGLYLLKFIPDLDTDAIQQRQTFFITALSDKDLFSNETTIIENVTSKYVSLRPGGNVGRRVAPITTYILGIMPNAAPTR